MKITFLLLISVFLLSCDFSSPEDNNKTLIRNSVEEIALGFNFDRLEEIMPFYSLEYLHNGDDIGNAELDWMIRLNDYQEMKIENLEIEVNGEEAVVSFNRLFFSNGNLLQLLVEPVDNGDMSYWELQNGDWKIVGNQNLYRD